MAAYRKRALLSLRLVVEPVCPGNIITGKFTEPPPEDGGPQEGVSGEIGAQPGSLVSAGGPQEGVSGEMGAQPGSLVSAGGPQEGVSGEMGAQPGSLFDMEFRAEASGDSVGTDSELPVSFCKDSVLSLSIYKSIDSFPPQDLNDVVILLYVSKIFSVNADRKKPDRFGISNKS